MRLPILTVSIKAEFDVVASRQRARQIASLCGFASLDQTRIATAVSELARNVYDCAACGKVAFLIEGIDDESTPQALLIWIEDDGPGIENLDLVLSGSYQSSTGMGLGILGAQRLMEQCDITTSSTSSNRGTRIVLRKRLPAHVPLLTSRLVGEMGARLSPLSSDVALSEVQQQNQELLSTLTELKARQEELLQLTGELEDTNRGVVALYAELDEKAAYLRRADEMKSRFLSNMSHEFRTPLNSIRALARLLLDRADGELLPEQEKQVAFIRQAATGLSEMVNDLLDMAKIEAGKIDVRPVRFAIGDMFRALRGMLRPLLGSASVTLIFEEAPELCFLYTDEAKLAQILRNYIVNALKFTEAGEVRVRATLLPEQAAVRFSVTDTGLGIAAENHQLIFEEFSQIANALQYRSKGTGLGLSLCRTLATVLGGHVGVDSTPGGGSTFWVVIPMPYMPAVDGRSPVAADVEGNAQGC